MGVKGDSLTVKVKEGENIMRTNQIADDMDGYVFSFDYQKNQQGYILLGAACLFSGLEQIGFTGRCECYSKEMFGYGYFIVSLAILLDEDGNKSTPEYEWWSKLEDIAADMAAQHKPRIEMNIASNEYCPINVMRRQQLHCGNANFRKGRITRVLGEDSESFFRLYIKDKEGILKPTED